MAEEFINTHLIDSLTAITRDDLDECYLDVEQIVSIPIQFWIYLEEDNAIFPTDLQLKIVMDNLNSTFSNSGMNVRFYMNCPNFIFDNGALEANSAGTYFNTIGNHVGRAINVHIIRELNGGTGGLYNSFGDYIVVTRSIYENTNRTLPHEIGHFFRLEHTHRHHNRGKCRQEAVDRNRTYGGQCIFKYGKICEKSGDGLCDTEAEQNLNSTGTFDFGSCTYIGNDTDRWGDSYLPNSGENIMSYGAFCRSTFTNQQVSAMWFHLIYYESLMRTLDLELLDPDKYEPDDSDEMGVPTEISIGEKQCHSFHQTLNDDCQDEVDWLIIDNTNGFIGSLIIELDQITEDGGKNYEYPVEEIVVWDTDFNQVRTNVKSVTRSQVGTKDIYEISCEQNPEDYLIQVIRKEDIKGGLYSISVKNSYEVLPEIIADNQVCIGGVLTIDNLPDGASVSWISPINISLSTNSGVTTSITATNDLFTNYFVLADISVGGCTYRIRHDFDEVATNNFPPFLNINMEVQGADCEPVFTFSVPPIIDATDYEWSCSSGNINFDGCYDNNSFETWGSAALTEGEQINISVSLEVSNDCGSNIQTSRTFIYTAGDNCDMRSPDFKVDINPNPITSGEEMNIIITDDSEMPTMDYNIIISSLYSEIEYNSNVNQFENQININSFSPGIHYLHIISGEKVASKMFVIQN